MARLFSVGFETQLISTSAGTGVEPALSKTGTVEIDTTVPRSGAACAKFAASGANTAALSITPTLNRPYWYRFAFRLSSLPASTIGIARLLDSTGTVLEMSVTAAGKLEMWNGVAAAHPAGEVPPVVEANRWYVVEMLCKVPSAGNGKLAWWLDGTPVVAEQEMNVRTLGINTLRVGNINSSAISIFSDDWAVNDDQGASETGRPGNNRKLVMLKPVSDKARTGFTGGAGGTTNLFEAVNNTPPVGLALGSATDLSQVKSANNNSTDNFEVNLGAYTEPIGSGGGGLSSSDLINLVSGYVRGGQSSATARGLGLTLVSNPAAAEVTGGLNAETAGTETTGWRTITNIVASVVYAPSVTKATQPVLKVRKSVSTTDATMVDFVGLLVEYTPATVYNDSGTGTVTLAGSSVEEWSREGIANPAIADHLGLLEPTDSLQYNGSAPDWLTLLPWAASAGTFTNAGWNPPGFSAGSAGGSRGGYYLNSGPVEGNAVAALQRGADFAELAERQFSTWLFIQKAKATATGYQLCCYQTGADNSYTFKLRRWVEGSETLLEEVAGVAMKANGAFAVVAFNGKVSAWVRETETATWKLIGIEVADTTFTSGYSGFDGNGSNPVVLNFITGALKTRRKQRRKPPLALDVEVETESGTFRLAADAKDPAKRPQGISFSTQRGDGFGPASCTLSRKIFKDYPDINLLDTWRFVGHQGDVAWEGRLHSNPRTNDPAQQISVSLVGWMTYLRNRKIAPLFIDSRLSSWGDASVARRANLVKANVKPGPSVSTGWQGTGSTPPGVVMDFTSWTTVSGYGQRGESWFYGGGEKIGALLYHFHVLTGPEGNASWLDEGRLATNDLSAAGEYQSGTDHSASTNSSAYERINANADRDYAVLISEWPADGGGTAMSDTHSWELPKVLGRQNLTLGGTWPEVGYSISDIMASVLSTYYPKITWAGEENSFIVQQAAWHDSPADGYEIIQGLNNLSLWETSVWEERKFYFHAADLTRFDWQIRTDDPGVSVVFEGESIEQFANGVSVSYTDFAGIRRVLWPDQHEELRDENPNNPANIHGEQLWTDCEVPTPCSEAEALQFGRTYLAEWNRPKRPGSFRVAGGYIKDAAGHWHQGWKVRSSQTIAVMNHPSEAPRLIFATNWDGEAKQLEITVDAPPKYLDAIVARQELSRTARGLA